MRLIDLNLLIETMELKKQLDRIMTDRWQVKADHESNKGEVFHEEAGARAFAKILLKYGYPVKVRVKSGNDPWCEWIDARDVWNL